MPRKNRFNAFQEAAARGAYDEFPMLELGIDPQLHLSRNNIAQPFFLICEQDSMIAQLSGAARIEFRDSSVGYFDARIGDYVIVARRERGGQTWFLGAITDEQARTFDVPLSFLTPGKSYVAEIYADGPKANWQDNPFPVTLTRRAVTSGARLHIVLAPGGGQAIRFRPAR